MIDEILQKLGLKYEDLDTPGKYSGERETLDRWLEALSRKQLTLENVKSHIVSMRESVEKELTRHDLNPKQDIFLKARLRNYMLLDAFLTSPEKAKEHIERSIASLVPNKK